MEEPIVEAHIMTPKEYVGTIMDLCQNKRGIFENMEMTKTELHLDIFYR